MRENSSVETKHIYFLLLHALNKSELAKSDQYIGHFYVYIICKLNHYNILLVEEEFWYKK